MCNTSIHNGVNSDISVTVEWSRNGVIIANGSDYSISEIKLLSDNYISTVRIEELQTSDNNAVFRCSVTVGKSDGNDEISIEVQGALISA